MMNFALYQNSPRLKRTHAVLADGEEHSTMDLHLAARVCNPAVCVGELRRNGAVIERRQVTRDGQRIHLYRMTKPVPDA